MKAALGEESLFWLSMQIPFFLRQAGVKTCPGLGPFATDGASGDR